MKFTRGKEKLAGKSATPLKYSSSTTRGTSLHSFMGDAAGDETYPKQLQFTGERRENLECQFQSGACRTDLPSAWGPASVDRRIGDKMTSVESEMFSWIRNKGEPRQGK